MVLKWKFFKKVGKRYGRILFKSMSDYNENFKANLAKIFVRKRRRFQSTNLKWTAFAG